MVPLVRTQTLLKAKSVVEKYQINNSAQPTTAKQNVGCAAWCVLHKFVIITTTSTTCSQVYIYETMKLVYTILTLTHYHCPLIRSHSLNKQATVLVVNWTTSTKTPDAVVLLFINITCVAYLTHSSACATRDMMMMSAKIYLVVVTKQTIIWVRPLCVLFHERWWPKSRVGF